uniref:Uncharacterized protein n=1 Tax=Mycena chlorophos TaxID=658473 RepID=A0ABQ0LAH1_MYCCL|nr:predicted protein [Mycena chlorophos]
MSATNNTVPDGIDVDALADYGGYLTGYILGPLAETCFVSLYTVGFVVTVYSILRVCPVSLPAFSCSSPFSSSRRSRGIRARSSLVMLCAISYLYAASVTLWALNFSWVFLFVHNLFEKTYDPGTSLAARLEIAHSVVDQFGTPEEALFLFNMLVGDSVVIWRVWVLYPRQFWAPAIPITLLLLSAGFAFTDIACLTGNNFSAQSSVAGGGAICTNAELISWAISLGTNAACTLLIGFKAWNHRRIMKDALGDLKPVRDPSRMSVDRTLSLLVESGFIYCLFWLTQVILFVPVGPHGSPESLAYEVPGALGDQLSGLYPTLIILIVNARRTVWDSDKNDAEWRSGISTVRFGPMASAGRSRTHHFSGIGDTQTPIDSEEDHDATGSQSWNSLKNGSQLRVENGEAIELS